MSDTTSVSDFTAGTARRISSVVFATLAAAICLLLINAPLWASAKTDLTQTANRAGHVSRAITQTTYIDLCSQQAQICPVDEDTWQGEPDAWQHTAKKWQRHTDTPSGINVMWESSFPYSGPNPDYADHRENLYADYTNTPDEYPAITGTVPIVYDWERWSLVGDTHRLRQFGRSTESELPFVGDTDCDSGFIFPLIDH